LIILIILGEQYKLHCDTRLQHFSNISDVLLKLVIFQIEYYSIHNQIFKFKYLIVKY
jgi:hypothetical protein